MCHRLAPSIGEDTRVLGKFLRDVAKLNQEQRNFRIFGPDETVSNLLGAVFEVTNRQWDARTESKIDEFLAPKVRCWTRCSASTSARDG